MQPLLKQIKIANAEFLLRTVAASAFIPLLLVFTAGAARADSTSVPAPPLVAGAEFGTPPSGEIPILYNDHTVYAKPDVLKQGRVLAALVKGGHIYVPLRSMFEQMGATVSASTDGNTVTAVKSGVTVSVTLGKHEVVINGETRPLDVPPILYKGILLVPVRVLSEALGAYVQWVPSQRVVVVRYIPATPEPVATPEPTVAPTPTPIPVPVARRYNGFVEAGFAAPKNYNEFSAGHYCSQSYVAAAAYMFEHSKFAVKFDLRHDSYVTSSNVTDAFGNQYTGFSTIDGGYAYTPVFLARQTSFDGRLEYQIAAPRIYVGVGALHTTTNYGYPSLNAVGVGVEKLPDLRAGVGFYGSAFYYPNASGNYTVTSPASSNFGTTYRQKYQITKYDVGLTLGLKHSPVYLYGGFDGETYTAKQNAPIGQTHNGPYVGLGVKF